ncbi:type II CAAX prenyl endopeptidase Rce1 family protein [Candidatus Latescibacterota bacterium]
MPDISENISKENIKSWFEKRHLVMAIIWLAVSVSLVTMLILNVRNNYQFGIARYVMQIAYVLVLLWYISKTGYSASQLPDIRPMVFPRWRYGNLIPVIAVALLLVLHIFSDSGESILTLLLIISTVWLLVVWRREIRLRMVIFGFAAVLIAFLGGLPFWQNSAIPEIAFIVYLVFALPIFVAGALLHKHTDLSGIQLLTGNFGKIMLSFLWDCLFFVPLGLINAIDDSSGAGFTWVSQWWMPLSLPFFSGIVEEIWFRLLLVGLCYFLLRPAFTKKPALAVVVTVLFSAITFGLGHGRTFDKFLTTGLLYGLPMAVVFVKRDFEHAVGAHYMVNMISVLKDFLMN